MDYKGFLQLIIIKYKKRSLLSLILFLKLTLYYSFSLAYCITSLVSESSSESFGDLLEIPTLRLSVVVPVWLKSMPPMSIRDSFHLSRARDSVSAAPCGIWDD